MDIVVGNEMCGVGCCMGSGIVEVQCRMGSGIVEVQCHMGFGIVEVQCCMGSGIGEVQCRTTFYVRYKRAKKRCVSFFLTLSWFKWFQYMAVHTFESS